MTSDCITAVGWDIGAVNVKAASATWQAGDVWEVRAAIHPFEVWRARGELVDVLRRVADDLRTESTTPFAVTMTAELSDTFRTKREGVLFVLDAVRRGFPGRRIYVLSAAGELVGLDVALQRPLDFAATNWMASALHMAERQRDGVLVDVGSTTTDIIPVREGRVVVGGRTDPDRLAAGELVYTGVLRTNPNTIAAYVPLRGRPCRVAAESFALMADVYLLLGRISVAQYTCPTADGRERSERAAADRLARVVCADGEMLSKEEIVQLARFFAERQVRQVWDGLFQVLSSLSDAHDLPVAPAGVGAFVAAEAGRRVGLRVLDGATLWGGHGDALPATAVARLLAQRLATEGA